MPNVTVDAEKWPPFKPSWKIRLISLLGIGGPPIRVSGGGRG